MPVVEATGFEGHKTRSAGFKSRKNYINI